MKEYHKIQSVFKRDEKTHKFIMGDYSREEFKFLENNRWVYTEKVMIGKIIKGIKRISKRLWCDVVKPRVTRCISARKHRKGATIIAPKNCTVHVKNPGTGEWFRIGTFRGLK